MAVSFLTRSLQRYAHWLHTQWPAGRVEPLPEAGEDGRTVLPGVRIVGDLTGIPLLKFSADSGARAVRAFAAEKSFVPGGSSDPLPDLAIIGLGVAGMAAALEARRLGLRFVAYDAVEPFATIVNFPKRKPIFTYPVGMTPAGELQFSSDVKEDLLEELDHYRKQAGVEVVREKIERLEAIDGIVRLHRKDGEPLSARRVIVAIGRSGHHRRLGVAGEELEKVSNRLHDPADFSEQRVLVVGGGDSAVESAVALAEAGASVTLSYRGKELSRPKPENLERLGSWVDDRGAKGSLEVSLGSEVASIRESEAILRTSDGSTRVLENDAVFVMIGREAPLGFFRRSGIPIRGEMGPGAWAAMSAFLVFCVWLYHWKSGKSLPLLGSLPAWLNPDPGSWWNALAAASGSLGTALSDPSTLLGTLKISASGPSFYYTLAYSLIVLVFGVRRIRRRRTPYVTVQTWTLTAVQWLPLFLLPEIILPLIGHNGGFEAGGGRWLADQFFPEVAYGHGREYWRAYGLILAWPLFVYNWFTSQPLAGWLVIGGLQTFVLIPLLIRRWGKGAYCGWICSCGALAETLGDQHRQKMPHGPGWNRLNLLGQGILGLAVLLLLLRIGGWIWPGGGVDRLFGRVFSDLPVLNYQWTVDLLLAGVLGYGLYFWYSGRMWCRFACPLAALMHVFTRFSRFRIFAEKKKCISCNVCTSVCHQGIDIMSFANKGRPMEDPECVRCSACVQSCPTGVLSFGYLGKGGDPVLDRLRAYRETSGRDS